MLLKNMWSDGNTTHDRLEQMVMMIYFSSATDIAVPFTHNVPNTEAEKMMKYVT
jgi:hypothetical protein